MVEIIEINSGKQLKQFIEFPNKLYKDHPYYVPALYISVEWMLGKKNPFLKHSKIALFMAMRNGEVMGRIAAIYNKTHIDRYRDATGFFGFFDSINDNEVAQKLFKASSDWLKILGLSKMMGPANLTTNDSCGILIDGFDREPMALMPYNFDYYAGLFQSCGFLKCMDLFSYEIDGTAVRNKYENIVERSLNNLSRNGITIRSLSAGSFSEDMLKLMPVYNHCNEQNWGFMPMNLDEFNALAHDLKMITPLDLTLVVEKENQMIGFAIAVPNINQVLKYIRNGKLFPLGIFKYLWYKRKITNARVLILGVLSEYSGTGLDLVLYQKIKEALNKRNIYTAEACYVLESNHQMNSILNKIDGTCIKKYRMYHTDI